MADDDRSIETFLKRVDQGYEGVDPKLQTIARSKNAPRAAAAAQDEIADIQSDQARIEQHDIARQQRIDTQRQHQQEGQARVAANKAARAAEVEARRQAAANVRAAAAAGAQTTTDIETGKRTVATHEDGTPKAKPGPIGGPIEVGKQVQAIQDPATGETRAIPNSDVMLGGGGLDGAAGATGSETRAIVKQPVRDDRWNVTLTDPETKTDKATGRTYTEAKDPSTGLNTKTAVGIDDAARKTADLSAKADAIALQKNQLAQSRLAIDAEYAPVKDAYAEAEKRVKALPPFQQDEAGNWVRVSKETGIISPVDDVSLARFKKEKQQAEAQMETAKRDHDKFSPRLAAIDAAEHQVKADHLRAEAERIKHEMRLPGNDGGVSRVLAQETTGDNPYGKFLKEFGIGAQDAAATPEEQVADAQATKEKALLGELAAQPDGTPVPRIPANDAAQQALATLKGVEGLTVSAHGPIGIVNGADGKWIATVEPERGGGTALTLRDAAQASKPINDLLQFDRAGNELPLFVRENDNRPTLKETAQWAAQVHSALLPEDPGTGIMTGGDGAASATGITQATTQVPATDAERGKLLESLGATPDQIKRRVANGEIPMQVGSSLLKELYGDTLVPDRFDDPKARQQWIEETTRKEIAQGVKPDQTTAARWKSATTKNSKGNAILGPISTLWSTYSLSEQNEIERDRVADFAVKNLGKPGVTRDQVKELYGRDAADGASVTDTINSWSTAMGKTAKYDAGAAMAGMLSGLIVDAGRYEVAMLGHYANSIGIENTTGDRAAKDLFENLGLRNRDFANFANGTKRNLAKWLTPDGREKSTALDLALAKLEQTIDADQQSITRNPDSIRAAELQVRNAALALHGLAPDESWPITADSLDPDKDIALGSALARYTATADPRQLELYKQRLLMSNGRRQFSAALEQKTKGLGRAGQSFVGGMSVGWQELVAEVVADASFAMTGGASTAALKSLRAAEIAGTVARTGRISRGAMAITEAAAKWERLGIKPATLAQPLTRGERFSNLAVKGGKLVAQGSLVGEPLEEMAVEMGADDPNFGQAYLGGMMGSVVMLPVFAGISKAAGAIVAAPEQAKFEKDVARWTQHYNTTYANTPGFVPITPETARTASQFINGKAAGSQANRLAAAQKLLGLTDEQVQITPEESEAATKGKQARTDFQAVEQGAAAAALDEKTRTNLESEAARLQQRLEQDSTSDQTGTGALKPDRRAALEEQLQEIQSRLGDSQATEQLPALQATIDETDEALSRTNAKVMLQQTVEHAAAFIAEGEANAVDAVNAIAAETDPARKTFMSGIAKVAAGNTHLLTKNERSAIQGTKTAAGASYFDSTVDPATGAVTEAITAEGRAELMETQPAIGRLVQTDASRALIDASLSTSTGNPADPAAMQANAERGTLTPEQTAQATEMASRVQAKLEAQYPSLKGRIQIQQQGGTFVSSGVSADIAENGPINIVVPDLAREIAVNGGNAAVVEQLTEATILRHELVHVAQFGSVIAKARAAGDTRADQEIFAERYTSIAADLQQNHPAVWQAAREIYGPANWDALNNPWAQAAETVRMLLEQRATGTTSELLAIVAQEKPDSIVQILADAIAYLKDLIASGFKSERIQSTEAAIATLSQADPALLAEHLAELESLYAQLLNAPESANPGPANPANRSSKPPASQQGPGNGSPAQKAGNPQANDPGAPQPAPGNRAGASALGGTVGSGKPGGVRVKFEWQLVPRAELAAAINRELGSDQNRSRKGNLGSDEQIQKIRNYPDPQYLLQAPGAREGAPVVDDALDGAGLSVIAGNGRAAGITLALETNPAGSSDFIAATRELAESLGLDYDAAGTDPVLVRKVTGEYIGGTREEFVAQSNQETLLAPTPAEQAKMDLVKLTPSLHLIEYGSEGRLSKTSAKAAAVALDLPRINQEGDPDLDTATRRVNLALLTRMADEAGIPFKTLSAIIEGKQGNRAMGTILSRAGAISQLPGDLAIRDHLFRALARFQSAARDISKADGAKGSKAQDWLAQQSMEIGESADLTPEARILLAPMLQSLDAGNVTALRDFLNDYLQAAQAEQTTRDQEAAMGNMFGAREDVSAFALLRNQLEQANTPREDGTRRTDLRGYIAGTLPKTGTAYTAPKAETKPEPAASTPTSTEKPRAAAATSTPPAPSTAPKIAVPDDGSVFAAIENGHEVATKTTPGVLARVKQWIDSMPGFQGGKREMAAPVTAAIEAAFSPEKRASFTKAVDFFGGGGNWGIFNALTSFPNIRDLVLYERNADRILKIRLFHEKGNLVGEMLQQKNVRDVLENAAAKMRQSGVKSGSALAVRIDTTGISDPLLLGLFQAIRDYAENSYAGATDADGNQTPEQKIATSIRIVAEQAHLAYKAAYAFRQRGGSISYRNADSYQAAATPGQDVLSLVDPPYYLTKGYTFAESVPDLIDGNITESVSETIVGDDTYAQTRDLLARAAAAGNAIIYTDSAWWKTSSGESTPYFDLPAQARNLYLPTGRAILSDIVDLFDSFGVVAGEIGAGRKEILGIHGHDITTQPGRRTRPQRDARNNEGQGSPDRRDDQPGGRGDDSGETVQPVAGGTPAEADPVRGERSDPVNPDAGTDSLASAPQDLTAEFKQAFTPPDPARLFADWAASTQEDGIVYGFRGERDNGQADNNFGSTEGHGLYLAKDRDGSDFFGKSRRVAFPQPKNPLIVDEQASGDTIPLLNEQDEALWEDILSYQIDPTDSPWIRAHKQAAEKVGLTSDNWGERMDDYTRAITDELLALGHDAVYVRSGGMEWVVILAKQGQRHQRGTRSPGGTSLYSAAQQATPQDQYAHKFLTDKLAKTGTLTPQEHQQLLDAERAVGQSHAFDMDDPALRARKRGTVTRNWQQNLMLQMEDAYEPDARQMSLFSASQDRLIEAALAPLTPMHRQVFQASQTTPTPTPEQLARRFSISEKAVENIIGQVRARLRTLSESQQTGGLDPAKTHEGLLIPGRPERAMTTNPVVARAQQIRAEEEIPTVITNEQTYAAARRMIAEDRQGTLDKLISRRANGETMTLEEVAAAQLFLRELGPQALDPDVRLQLAWLASDWIDQGTDDARRLQIRRDVTHNPAERAALYFRAIELTPQDDASRRAMSAAATRAQKEAVLQKWFARVDGIKAKLKADGIDLDASIAALDARLQAQQQAQNEASARHSNLVRQLEEDASHLRAEAERLQAQVATAQGDTAAARQQAAEAEQRAQAAASRAQQAAQLDPKATLRLNLEKLPLNHRAAIENILAGGTLDTAAMIGGTTVNAFRKVFTEFRDRINAAGQQAALLARDVQLGRLASASLSSPAGLDWASAIGIPTLDELDRRSVPISPGQAAARNKRNKAKKTAPAVKIDPPMMSDAEFARRIANPAAYQDRAQTFLVNAHTVAMAKLPVGKRISLDAWIAKLPPAGMAAIQQDMALKVNVGKSTDKALPTDGIGLLDFTDPEAVKNAAQIFANESGTVMDSLLDFRRMAILSGAQTSLVNTTSAAMLGLFFNARRLPEAMVNSALRPFGIRSDKAATFSEFPALARAIPQAAALAARHMVTAWKLEERDVDSAMLGTPVQMGIGGGGWHHETVTKGRFVGKFVKFPIPTTKGFRMVPVGDIMRGLTYRQMTASDAFITAFNGHLGAVGHAHRIAAHREKLTGAAYDARIAELMLPGSEAMVHGFREGTRATSTQPLGKTADGFKSDGRPESLTAHHTIDIFIDLAANTVNKWRKKRFGDMRDVLPFMLDLAAPFVVTPANLYKEAGRLTPIVNLGLAGIDAMRAWHTLYGKEGRAHPEIAKQRAKQIWDSYRTVQEITNQILSLGALYLVASYAAGSGDDPPLVTGTEPWKQTDRDARDTNARVMKPMSLRIPGTDLTFSYARMDPFATALASTIDMVRNAKMGLPVSEQIARFFTSQKNQVKEKTMLDGLARILSAIEAPDRNFARYLADLNVSMVPNMVRQPVRELDPVVRDTTVDPNAGFWSSVADRTAAGIIPQTAPPKLDAYGKPLQRRNPDKPLVSGPIDAFLSVLDPTHMVRLPDAAPLDRYLFDYNATVKPEDRIGIGPLDNHVVAKKDGKQVKLLVTPVERQEATARAAERAVRFLGTGWETRERNKEGAERIKDIFSQFQRMETERLRQQKLRKPAP